MRVPPTIILVLVLLASGCAQTPAPGPDAPPATSNGPSGPSTERFTDCNELDFFRIVPYDTTGLGPFRPVPADPAGQTMQLVYTVIRCASLDRGSSYDEDPTAIFSVLNVEALPEKRDDGAVAYQLVRTLTTDQPDLLADWGAFGVQTARSPVTIAFDAVGTNPAASATFSVHSSLHDVSGTSVMAGAPNAGTGGLMGLYTLAPDDVVHLHRAAFSDYRNYPEGAVVLRPGIAGVPANAVQAYHNIGFDLEFTLEPSGLAAER